MSMTVAERDIVEAETAENMRAREFRDLLGVSLRERVGLADMRAWVDRQGVRDMASADVCRVINGVFEPHHVRGAAIASKLLDFLDKCIEHQDEVATLFRAIAHRQRRRA